MTLTSIMPHEVQYRNHHSRCKLIADDQELAEKLTCNPAGSSRHILLDVGEKEVESIFPIPTSGESDSLGDYRNPDNSRSWTALGLDPTKLTK
jgi:hypothetical protein